MSPSQLDTKEGVEQQNALNEFNLTTYDWMAYSTVAYVFNDYFIW